MKDWRTIAGIRREYGASTLNEEQLEKAPLDQFKLWFSQTLVYEKNDPTAMVLSTVDERNCPDSRVVLLKGLEEDGFVFYSNYESHKGVQLEHTPYAALNFYWAEMARQVRIRGQVRRLSHKESDLYFSTRPLESQLSAIASHQSHEIPNRQALEERFKSLLVEFKDKPITRPSNWGGYCVIPEEMEFWQGRDNRLHDRFQYLKYNGNWVVRRLAP